MAENVCILSYLFETGDHVTKDWMNTVSDNIWRSRMWFDSLLEMDYDFDRRDLDFARNLFAHDDYMIIAPSDKATCTFASFLASCSARLLSVPYGYQIVSYGHQRLL